MSHKHHEECRHRHEHTNQCQHGTPTAIPRKHVCPVCGSGKAGLLFCQVHRQWECRVHVIEGVHHNPERDSKARAEEARGV